MNKLIPFILVILIAVAWYATRKDKWDKLPYGDPIVQPNELDWLT
jgi:hypothetical protein